MHGQTNIKTVHAGQASCNSFLSYCFRMWQIRMTVTTKIIHGSIPKSRLTMWGMRI